MGKNWTRQSIGVSSQNFYLSSSVLIRFIHQFNELLASHAIIQEELFGNWCEIIDDQIRRIVSMGPGNRVAAIGCFKDITG